MKPYNKSRPGVLALPATHAAADHAAAQGYADSIRRPAAAVKNFDDGSWALPGGSLVIVDDADRLDPGLLASLVETAAVRTNTKLILITNHDTSRTSPEGTNAVTVLQDHLPWARHIGTPTPRNIERDNVIDHVQQHLSAAGRDVDSPILAEAAHLLARREDLARGYREEVTARDRFITDMVARSRDRELGLSRDDGLEL